MTENFWFWTLQVSNYEIICLLQREWCHTLPRSRCPTSPCPPSKMPTKLSALRSTSDRIMLMVRKYNLKLAWLLNDVVCCLHLHSLLTLNAFCTMLCSMFVIFFFMYNLTASSVPPLSPSPLPLSPAWWEGLILYAGESQRLRTTGTQEWTLSVLLFFFGSIRLSHVASSSELMSI